MGLKGFINYHSKDYEFIMRKYIILYCKGSDWRLLVFYASQGPEKAMRTQ